MNTEKLIDIAVVETGPFNTSSEHAFPVPEQNVLHSDPKNLEADRNVKWMLNAYDAFLCLMPLVLVAKTCLCIAASVIDKSHHGVEVDLVSNLTTFLVNFNGQLSTAFTIVFITIMTTTVRRWALYKAQQGALLTELEQLQASISLPSTIKMIWSLRSYGFLSAGLVCIWCFYYLGSQACKLEYVFSNSRPYSQIPLALAKSNLNGSMFLLSQNSSDFQNALPTLNQRLISTLYYTSVSDKDAKPYDLWGNPLVPIREYTGTASSGAWVDVTSPDGQWYTSYAGPDIWTHTPLSQFGLLSGPYYDDSHQYLGDLQFSTQYTLASCGNPEQRSFDAFPNGTLPGSDLSINMTNNDRAPDADGKPTLPRQMAVWGRWNMSPGSFGVTQPNGSMVSICNLTQSFVDVKVHCSPSGCAARKVRYSPGNLTSLPSTPFDDDQLALSFFDNLLASTGPPTVNETGIIPESTTISSVIGLFSGVMSILADPGSDPTAVEDTESNMQSGALQLTAMINTYYAGSQLSAYCDVGIDQNDERHNLNCDQFTSKGAVYDPQYRLSIPWIVVDYISSLILLTAAIFGYWLRKRTLAPDIFGYVSSLTRDNPRFNHLAGDGTGLSGLERTRMLANMRIKICDVANDDEQVGKIAVVPAVDGQEAKRLMKERKYI